MSGQRLPLLAITALIVWLPLSTPAAVLTYEYAGANATLARLILLSKDLAAFAVLAGILLSTRRLPKLVLVDKAALLYAAIVVAYSIVPLAIGSHVPLDGVTASARQLLFPVLMYAIGRLVGDAGMSAVAGRRVVVVGVATAVGAEVIWGLLPIDFLMTRYDLVSFIREVQGFVSADNLWNVSILGQYTGSASLQFVRAVGPFTHPVGLAHFLVLPLALAFAIGLERRGRAAVPWFLAAAVIGFGVIATISRGSWAAAAIAIAICALGYRRLVAGAAALAVAAIVVITVPAFALSLMSVAQGSDPSTAGHIYAVQANLDTYLNNPLGAGVGSADKFGAVDLDPNAPDPAGPDQTAEALGVGENLYLSLLINIGPLGLLAFLAWIGGSIVRLVRARRERSTHWMVIATLAATLGYLASAMTSSPLFRFSSSGMFWLVLGLVIATTVVRNPDRADAAPEQRTTT